MKCKTLRMKWKKFSLYCSDCIFPAGPSSKHLGAYTQVHCTESYTFSDRLLANMNNNGTNSSTFMPRKKSTSKKFHQGVFGILTLIYRFCCNRPTSPSTPQFPRKTPRSINPRLIPARTEAGPASPSWLRQRIAYISMATTR